MILSEIRLRKTIYFVPSQTNDVWSKEPSVYSPIQRYIVNKAVPSLTKSMNINIYFANIAANKQCVTLTFLHIFLYPVWVVLRACNVPKRTCAVKHSEQNVKFLYSWGTLECEIHLQLRNIGDYVHCHVKFSMSNLKK